LPADVYQNEGQFTAKSYTIHLIRS
jgi:hypothetical protein